jgi:hypothetical protein
MISLTSKLKIRGEQLSFMYLNDSFDSLAWLFRHPLCYVSMSLGLDHKFPKLDPIQLNNLQRSMSAFNSVRFAQSERNVLVDCSS